MKDIIVYTMRNCSYCQKIKNVLDQNNLEYSERDVSEFPHEWEKVKNITRSPMFPTIELNGEYFVPGRDYNNDQQLILLLNRRLNAPKLEYDLDILVREGIKSLNANLNSLQTKFVTLAKDVSQIQKILLDITQDAEEEVKKEDKDFFDMQQNIREIIETDAKNTEQEEK